MDYRLVIRKKEVQMKKIHYLKFFGFLAILIFVLVFVGIDIVESQVKLLKKPPDLPSKDKYVWSAVILDQGETGFGLRGMEAERYDSTYPGWVYEDTEPNVNVDVEIRSAPYDGETKYWTRFTLEIFNPVQIDLEFMPWDAWFYPDTPEAQCRYPGGYDPDVAFSMFDFMQASFHPHPEYYNFWIRFNTDRSVNPGDIDYEQWTYHEIMKFLARINTPPMNLFKPETCEELNLSDYSTIEFGGGDYGFFERIDENTWIAVIGMEKNLPDYYTGPGVISEDDAWATDWYQVCVETQINKKKSKISYDAIFSAQGQFDIKFAVLFIRTKI
jgi:hypothetical protein